MFCEFLCMCMCVCLCVCVNVHAYTWDARKGLCHCERFPAPQCSYIFPTWKIFTLFPKEFRVLCHLYCAVKGYTEFRTEKTKAVQGTGVECRVGRAGFPELE